VVDRPLAEEETRGLTAVLKRNLGDFTRIDFRYFRDLPSGANGKFEEFVSLLPD
jgi:hypothetical protein